MAHQDLSGQSPRPCFYHGSLRSNMHETLMASVSVPLFLPQICANSQPSRGPHFCRVHMYICRSSGLTVSKFSLEAQLVTSVFSLKFHGKKRGVKWVRDKSGLSPHFPPPHIIPPHVEMTVYRRCFRILLGLFLQ
jgi:hypothetical protein